MNELKRIDPTSSEAEDFVTLEALPCPHCGCKELSAVDWCDDDGEYYAVECAACKAAAPMDVWNRRT